MKVNDVMLFYGGGCGVVYVGCGVVDVLMYGSVDEVIVVVVCVVIVTAAR